MCTVQAVRLSSPYKHRTQWKPLNKPRVDECGCSISFQDAFDCTSSSILSLDS